MKLLTAVNDGNCRYLQFPSLSTNSPIDDFSRSAPHISSGRRTSECDANIRRPSTLSTTNNVLDRYSSSKQCAISQRHPSVSPTRRSINRDFFANSATACFQAPSSTYMLRASCVVGEAQLGSPIENTGPTLLRSSRHITFSIFSGTNIEPRAKALRFFNIDFRSASNERKYSTSPSISDITPTP